MSQTISNKRFLTRDYLQKLRYSRNLTQKQVATLLGIEPFVYNGIENGRRGSLMNAKRLYAIAKAFDISCEQVLLFEIAYLNDVETRNSKKNE